MTGPEFILLVIGFPFAVALGAWQGRKAQRFLWGLDRPYAERVAALKQSHG